MFAPDGRHVLTIGGNDAQLWNLESRRPVDSLQPARRRGLGGRVADGKLIATGSWDHSAKIWDAATGHAIRKLDGGHTGYINSVEFSPDGRELLTASDDGTALLLERRNGQADRHRVPRPHGPRALRHVFARRQARAHGQRRQDGADLGSREPASLASTLKGHDWAVLCGQFSPDGQRIITGSQDTTARIWDARTGHELVKLEGHTAAVTSVAFSPDGTRVLTGSQDNTAKLWDAADRQGNPLAARPHAGSHVGELLARRPQSCSPPAATALPSSGSPAIGEPKPASAPPAISKCP